MSTPDFPQEQPSGTPAPLAQWGDRALGFLIDYAPIFILGIIFYRSVLVAVVLGLAGLAYWAYLGNMEGTTGQTPGKAIMGLRLVDANGQLVGSGPGIGRKFAHIIDSFVCGLGYLLPLVDAKKQTIADKVMNTYVVSGLERKSFSFDLWLPSTSE